MLDTMSFNFSTLVVIIANLLGGTMAVPQAVQLVRTRRADGVSPAWAGMSITLNVWWVAYAIGVGEWAIAPVGVVSAAAYLVIALSIIRFSVGPARQTMTPMLFSAMLLGAAPLIGLLVGGWQLAGVLLGALYGVQLTPAVITVYRSVDVSGVSPATWVIALSEAALWGLYGLPRADAGLISLAATGAVMSSLVLLRLITRRPRRARTSQGATGFDFAPA